MSQAIFNRWFTNPLVAKLQAEKRKKLESTPGQLLVLDNIAAFHQVILVEMGIDITEEQAGIALAAGQKEARTLQKAFRSKFPARYNAIVKKKPSILRLENYTIGEDLFVVHQFTRSLSAIKKAIFKSLETQGVLTPPEITDLGVLVQKGHGVGGLAVSQVQIASTLGVAAKKLDIKSLRSLNAAFQQGKLSNIEADILDELFTTYNQQVTTTGDVRTDYVSVITFQEKAHNEIVDRQTEVRVKNAFKKFLRSVGSSVLNQKGSSTLKEKIETVILDSVIPTNKKNVKVTRSKKVALKSKGSGRAKIDPKSKAPTATLTRLKSEGPRRNPRTGRFISKKTVDALSPTALRNIINAKLPEYVARNMGSPRLNYITGRFAESTRIADIRTNKDGSPSIGYTYDLYPYQTFEPGYAQGSVERDPRSLIDLSIRQILSSLQLKRFTTRRV